MGGKASVRAHRLATGLLACALHAGGSDAADAGA